MPFTYWNDATEYIRKECEIAADVWGCEPYTYTPNGRRVPLVADFCPGGEPIAWYPGDPLGHAVRLSDVAPWYDELHNHPSYVTCFPSRPKRSTVAMPFRAACQTVKALVQHTTPRHALQGYRGIVTDVVPPTDRDNDTGKHLARIAGDGVLIATAPRFTKAEADAVQTAWMRWERCSWFEIRDAAEKHGWGAVTKWAFEAL